MEIARATALITGGASGLGLATAELLTRAGAAVVILDLPQSAGSEAAARLGDKAHFSAGDVTDPEAVTSALDVCAQTGKPLRILVNCAGIGPPARLVGKNGPFPLALFRKIVEVNLVGTFN